MLVHVLSMYGLLTCYAFGPCSRDGTGRCFFHSSSLLFTVLNVASNLSRATGPMTNYNDPDVALCAQLWLWSMLSPYTAYVVRINPSLFTETVKWKWCKIENCIRSPVKRCSGVAASKQLVGVKHNANTLEIASFIFHTTVLEKIKCYKVLPYLRNKCCNLKLFFQKT